MNGKTIHGEMCGSFITARNKRLEKAPGERKIEGEKRKMMRNCCIQQNKSRNMLLRLRVRRWCALLPQNMAHVLSPAIIAPALPIYSIIMSSQTRNETQQSAATARARPLPKRIPTEDAPHPCKLHAPIGRVIKPFEPDWDVTNNVCWSSASESISKKKRFKRNLSPFLLLLLLLQKKNHMKKSHKWINRSNYESYFIEYFNREHTHTHRRTDTHTYRQTHIQYVVGGA